MINDQRTKKNGIQSSFTLLAGRWPVLVMMLIYREKKILLNGG
jgi:hypothetical protein